MAAAGTWEDPRIVGPTFAGEQAWKTYATDLMAHKVRGSVVKGVSQRNWQVSIQKLRPIFSARKRAFVLFSFVL
jgi:hypothetical protein